MSNSGSRSRTRGQQDSVSQSGGPQQPASRAGQSSTSTISASALARDDTKFAQWQHAARLAQVIRDLDMTQPDSCPASIRQLLLAAKRIPEWVSEIESIHLAQVAELYPKKTRDLCMRIRGNLALPTNAKLFETHHEEDRELITLIPHIIDLSDRTEVFLLDHQACPNEAELRTGVDLLLYRIFPRDSDIVHMLERSLKLPEVGMRPVVSSVKPDAIDVIRLPSLEPYRGGICDRLSCFFASKPPDRLQVVHCVTEFKSKGKGERQVLMGIVSAMYQRYALGIDNQLVFGIIQDDGLYFRVVAAKWQAGKIEVYNLGVFHLNQSIATLRFFVLLREIRRIGEGYLNEIIYAMDRSDASTIIGQVSSKPWVRPKPKSSRHSKSSLHSVDEADDSDDDGNQTEAGDESGLMSAELEAAVLSWSYRIYPHGTDRSPTQHTDEDSDLDQSCLLSGTAQLTKGENTNLRPSETSSSSESDFSTLDNSPEIGGSG
ncbi:hypothetical protein RhiJN_06655 [Ceratobasidium sp. AG-Ba]|nr:hypothetical protein RhiJN_06655 [Ceratobasidium sp. AG-Ba]